MPGFAAARRGFFRTARPGEAPGLLWRAARRWTAAAVVGLFPILFALDEGTRLGFSPVLPGLAALALLIVALPFALVSLFARRHRGLAPELQRRKAARLDEWAGVARTAAALAFLAWLAWGA